MERKMVFGVFIMLKVEEVVVAAGCYGFLGFWLGRRNGTSEPYLLLLFMEDICLMILR